MSINYTPFYAKLWSDKKFKALPLSSRFLFIYLFTNEAVSLCGIYELDIETCQMRVKLGDDFKDAMNRIIGSNMVKWDESSDTIFVVNRFKHIPNKSPKVLKGVINELNLIRHSFKQEFLDLYKDDLGEYKPTLLGYEQGDVDLLTAEQIKAFMKLGWQKERLKKFYIDRGYPEQRIDAILEKILPRTIR